MSIGNRRARFRAYGIGGLCIVFILASSCPNASGGQDKLADLVAIKLVAPERFIQLHGQLHEGLSCDQVQRLLGTIGQHELTARVDDTTYLITYVWVGKGSDPWADGIVFYLLFIDGKLNKVIRPYDIEHGWEVPSGPSEWTVTDNWDIDSLLALKSVSREKMLKAFKILDMKDYGPSNVPWFAWKLIANMMGPEYRVRKLRDRRTNKQLLDKYDPFSIKLGMTMERVNEILGEPKLTQRSNKGDIAAIYGEDIKLEVPPEYKFSHIAVLFEKGMVSRVLSNSCFYEGWKQGRNIFD